MKSPYRTYFFILLRVLVLPVLMAMTVKTVMAEPVNVRGQAVEDYAKIIFNWQTPVGHTLTRDGNLVQVRFSRPIDATLTGVARPIKKFIDRVDPGDDDNTVTITLNGNFDVYSYDTGRSVIVEIAPLEGEGGNADSAEKPAPAAADQNTLAKIKVRVGAHDGFTRLVFDWKTKPAYDFSRTGNVAELVFDSPGDIQLQNLGARPPKYIGAIRQDTKTPKSRVKFSVAASSTVKHFVSGQSIVVDITAPANAGDQAGPIENDNKQEIAKQEGAVEKSKPEDVQKTPEPESKPVQALTPQPTQTAKQQPAVGQEKTKPAETETKTKTKTAVEQTPTETAEAEPKRLEPQALTSAADGQVALENAAEAKITSIASTDEKVLATLRFDWENPVGAAVFRRAGALWVVFDTLTQVDTEEIKKTSGQYFKQIQQIPVNTATVLRFLTETKVNPTLSRDGLSWILTFKKQDLEARTPVEVQADPNSPIGARIFLPVTEPGRAIPMTDPEVGDNLIVVPLVQLGYGIQKPFDFAQVSLIQTGQGVVISPKFDELRIRTLRQGIEMSGNTLKISPVGAGAAASAKLASRQPLAKILKLDPWQIEKIEDYYPKKVELVSDLASAGPSQRTDARYNMARFYLANGFGAEAIGVLNVIASAEPEQMKTPEFNMMIGASQFLMGRYDDADLNFSKPALAGADEARLWRALIVAKRGDLSSAGFELRRLGGIARSYPSPLRTPVGQLIAKAAIEIGDVTQAQDYLTLLRTENTDPADLAELDNIEARMLQLSGDDDGAIKKWDFAIENGRRKVRVEAAFSRMELMQEIDRMTRPQAIKILEDMRYVWRDDEFEFNLLRRLGDYYIEEGRYRQGFLALRQAATVFRTNVEAPQVTQKMTDTFNFLFLNDGADSLTPVQAIGLYEEFKELTPAGTDGDLMIRKLADRLVRVDLLDSAAALLENQIKFRLKGELKATVGTRLALVRIIAREYDQALQALDDTVEPNLPESLVTERRHLRAQALMGKGEKDAAAELLKTDQTPGADLLKTEMFWQNGDWAKASLYLKRILTASGAKPKQPLDNDQAANVLNLAVAMTLSGNERALNRLRRDYAGPMEATEYKDAFNLVTSPGRLGLVPPGAVAGLVKDAENFKTFLSDYLERIKKDDLSGVAAPIVDGLNRDL